MRHSRALAALGLTVGAIALPAAAWYVVGAREAAREAARIRRAPQVQARAAAERMAELISERLEQLRLAESDRPAPEYQNLYHDPRGATKGVAVVPSPLANGPQDPWILAHFQVDERGTVTLPTVNLELPDANFTNDAGGQRQLLAQLEPAVTACRVIPPRDARRQQAAPIGQSYAPGPQQVVQQEDAETRDPTRPNNPVPRPEPPMLSTQEQVPANPRFLHTGGEQVRVQKLSPESWAQNRAANSIWNEVKNGALEQSAQPATPTPAGMPNKPPGPAPGPGVLEIRSGPFEWRWLDIPPLGPSLVAVRWVLYPDGAATQGWLVDHRAVDAACAGGSLPARFTSTPPAGAEAVPVATLVGVGDAPWVVAVDADTAAAAAQAEADAVESGFRQSFAVGLAAALLAGLCVVGLVWRTERLAAERAQFAAAAAHELRTPLAGLRMYGEMLADGLGDPTRRDQYARRVADEAERLGRVVTNVLEYTRLERGTLRVQTGPEDLGAAVSTAVAKQQAALQAAGCPVDLALPETPVVAACDRDAVTQIVHNLLDNAEKYTRGVPERRARLTVARRDGQAQVTVADNGPGVPARLRRTLFQPFTRTTDPDAPAGLGLGLALTHALARAQGGSLEVADAPGGGAAFTLTLPLAAGGSTTPA